MRIRKRDKWKTLFKTWYSHFEYYVMFFGLINALVSFQRYINKDFAEKLNIFVIMYLDNILIYNNNNRDSHVAAVC